jgi:hypothetical protein
VDHSPIRELLRIVFAGLYPSLAELTVRPVNFVVLVALWVSVPWTEILFVSIRMSPSTTVGAQLLVVGFLIPRLLVWLIPRRLPVCFLAVLGQRRLGGLGWLGLRQSMSGPLNLCHWSIGKASIPEGVACRNDILEEYLKAQGSVPLLQLFEDANIRVAGL